MTTEKETVQTSWVTCEVSLFLSIRTFSETRTPSRYLQKTREGVSVIILLRRRLYKNNFDLLFCFLIRKCSSKYYIVELTGCIPLRFAQGSLFTQKTESGQAVRQPYWSWELRPTHHWQSNSRSAAVLFSMAVLLLVVGSLLTSIVTGKRLKGIRTTETTGEKIQLGEQSLNFSLKNWKLNFFLESFFLSKGWKLFHFYVYI